MAGPMVGPLLERLRLDLVYDLLGPRRRVPRPRAQPAAAGEPPVHHRARAGRRAPTSGSPGTATPIAASSSTTAASSSTATSSPRCSPGAAGEAARRDDPLRRPRQPGGARHRRGGRAAPPHQPGRPRVLEARDAGDGGEFGGEVSGHYYFRDFWYADSGTLPALLVLELLSVDGRKLSDLVGELRSRYFISGEINSEVADQEAKMKEIADAPPRRRDQPGSTGSRSTTPTGTSTSAPPTPSRSCASTSSRWSRARTWRRSGTRSSH